MSARTQQWPLGTEYVEGGDGGGGEGEEGAVAWASFPSAAAAGACAPSLPSGAEEGFEATRSCSPSEAATRLTRTCDSVFFWCVCPVFVVVGVESFCLVRKALVESGKREREREREKKNTFALVSFSPPNSKKTTHPCLSLGGPGAHGARLLGRDGRRVEGDDVADGDRRRRGARQHPHEQALDRRERGRAAGGGGGGAGSGGSSSCRCRGGCCCCCCCCCCCGLSPRRRRYRGGGGVEGGRHRAARVVDDSGQPRRHHRGHAGADGLAEGLAGLGGARRDGHGVDVAGLEEERWCGRFFFFFFGLR